MEKLLETSNGVKRKITSFFICLLYLIIILLIITNFYFNLTVTTAKKIDLSKIRQTDEILVKYKNNQEIVKIKVPQSADFDKLLKAYSEMPDVEYAESNYTYQATIIPTDSYFTNQWYLQKIKAVQAWNTIRESPKIVIAILDSGVQIDHPDLKSNIWINKKEIAGNNKDDDKNGFIDDVNGWDFVNNVPDPSPKFLSGFSEAGILHGTIVAGIAAASGNNAAGISGVTWQAQLMPLKVLDDTGAGNTLQVVKAIDYAIANGADIINLSFVGEGFSKSLDDAIKRAYDKGIIVVAAGGNEPGQGEGNNLDQLPMYPVCHDGTNGDNRVIGVAATDTMDQKAFFSGYGFKCIDIAAPGISVFSTMAYSPTNYIGDKPFNKYYDGYWSGTSVAVPMISGAIALIEAANPSLDRNEVVKILLDSSDNINPLNPNFLNKLGKGRLNLELAVNQASSLLTNQLEMILTAPAALDQSSIKMTNQDGKVAEEFLAYSDKFKGGASVTSGDVNGDGQAEIIVGAGPGGGPHLKIFNSNGELLKQFFALAENYRAGINIAAGDINQDGKDEIIVGTGFGALPEVRMFDYQGKLIGTFLAYDKNSKSGVNVAVGDIDGDGKNEIITGAGQGGGPQVRIFKPSGLVVGQFFAYDTRFRGGVRVTIADINGGARNHKDEIITAPGKGGGPQVKIFDNKGNTLGQFFAYNSNFRGGVNLATADLNNDGLAEIITGAGPGGAPHVRVFKANGSIIGSFYAYKETFIGGVNVGALKSNLIK